MTDQTATATLPEWAAELEAHGKLSFSLEEVKSTFPQLSDTAIKMSLNRLAKKKKVLSVFRGYYLIVPAQYRAWGIQPPSMFIDNLMRHLGRPYYVGLLSAAAIHGSAHQAPQEFQVFTTYPVMRPIEKKQTKVVFVSKKLPPESLLEKRKTETGYIKISKPELTAADLVQFQSRIGGINRAATVLNELAEEIKPDSFSEEFIEYIPTSTLQRLGCLLEYMEWKNLADILFEKCKNANKRFYKIPLKAGQETEGLSINKRWKIFMNITIEIDT